MPTKKSTIKKVSAKKVSPKTPKKTVRKQVHACVCTEVCKPGESFWVNYGPIVDTVAALREAITTMSDEQYRYHVGKGRNDFASWIQDCFGNADLAGRVAQAKTKAATQKALSTCCK